MSLFTSSGNVKRFTQLRDIQEFAELPANSNVLLHREIAGGPFTPVTSSAGTNVDPAGGLENTDDGIAVKLDTTGDGAFLTTTTDGLQVDASGFLKLGEENQATGETTLESTTGENLHLKGTTLTPTTLALYHTNSTARMTFKFNNSNAQIARTGSPKINFKDGQLDIIDTQNYPLLELTEETFSSWPLSFSNRVRITNSRNPVNNQDLTTKKYVDDLVAGSTQDVIAGLTSSNVLFQQVTDINLSTDDTYDVIIPGLSEANTINWYSTMKHIGANGGPMATTCGIIDNTWITGFLHTWDPPYFKFIRFVYRVNLTTGRFEIKDIDARYTNNFGNASSGAYQIGKFTIIGGSVDSEGNSTVVPFTPGAPLIPTLVPNGLYTVSVETGDILPPNAPAQEPITQIPNISENGTYFDMVDVNNVPTLTLRFGMPIPVTVHGIYFDFFVAAQVGVVQTPIINIDLVSGSQSITFLLPESGVATNGYTLSTYVELAPFIANNEIYLTFRFEDVSTPLVLVKYINFY